MSSQQDDPLSVEKILRYGGRQYSREFEGKDVDLPGTLEQLDEEIEYSGVDFDDFSEYFSSLTQRDLYTEGLLLGVVLNGRYNEFTIPDYQRNYSWDKKQNQRFWLSIHDALKNVGGDDIPEFYMGSMYVAEERNSLEIIDGQQRLTTLLLIMLNIRKYLKALSEHTDPSTRDEVWDLVDFIVGPRCLENMLYNGNRPVLNPSAIDKPYLELLFREDPQRIVDSAENIDIESDGRRIGVDTLLHRHLGIDTTDIEQHLSTPEPGTIYYGKSHERLIAANHTYRREIGKLLGVVDGCVGSDLQASVQKVTGDEVTVECTTEGYPSVNVELVVMEGDTLVAREHTDESGRATVDLSGASGGGKIIARKHDESKVIPFSSASDLIPEEYELLDYDTAEGEASLRILRNGEAVGDTEVSINELEVVSDENGVVEFTLADVDAQENEEGGETAEEDDEPRYTFEALEMEVSFDSIDELKPDEKTTEKICSNDQQRAVLLINIFLILLHAMRVVYAEFSLSDDEYKIEIFQSLNDRGKDLDVSDIIRARVIASDASDPDHWNEIVKRFSEEDDTIVRFLKNYLVAEQGIDSPSTEDVKSLFGLRNIGNPEVTSLLLEEPDSNLEMLNRYSERYHEIKQASLPDDTDEIGGLDNDDSTDRNLKEECEVIFKHLNEVGNVWEPFVLTVYKNFSEETNQGSSMVDIFRTVEKIIYRYSFFGQDIASTVISDMFPTACKRYNSGSIDRYDASAIREMLKRNLPNGLEDSSVINQLVKKENWTSSKVETLFLKLLEDSLLETDSRGSYTTGHFWVDPEADLTVEHILPQTYLISSDVDNKLAWLEHFFDGVDSTKTIMQTISSLDPDDPSLSDADDDDITDLFVHDIANMILLVRSDNSTIKNKLFSKKAAFYYMVCKEDLERSGEYLLRNEIQFDEVVSVIEELADEVGMDDNDLIDILGLLIESSGGPTVTTIASTLSRPDIDESDLSPTDYEGDTKDLVSKLMSFDEVDETSSGVGPSVDEYNRKWNCELMIQRKFHIINELLESVTIDGYPDEFDEDIEALVREDMERRYDLRRTA